MKWDVFPVLVFFLGGLARYVLIYFISTCIQLVLFCNNLVLSICSSYHTILYQESQYNFFSSCRFCHVIRAYETPRSR
ncbi:hypothetical protein BDD12DRAFT_823691 [Trichophaea hybrida]|nr:hypothetical protein BDD12DRAFT_823691 [Trichophaea hybrida]